MTNACVCVCVCKVVPFGLPVLSLQFAISNKSSVSKGDKRDKRPRSRRICFSNISFSILHEDIPEKPLKPILETLKLRFFVVLLFTPIFSGTRIMKTKVKAREKSLYFFLREVDYI